MYQYTILSCVTDSQEIHKSFTDLNPFNIQDGRQNYTLCMKG